MSVVVKHLVFFLIRICCCHCMLNSVIELKLTVTHFSNAVLLWNLLSPCFHVLLGVNLLVWSLKDPAICLPFAATMFYSDSRNYLPKDYNWAYPNSRFRTIVQPDSCPRCNVIKLLTVEIKRARRITTSLYPRCLTVMLYRASKIYHIYAVSSLVKNDVSLV